MSSAWAGLLAIDLTLDHEVAIGNTVCQLSQEQIRPHAAQRLACSPAVAVFMVVLAVNVLGDALRDALDPRHESLRRLETPV